MKFQINVDLKTIEIVEGGNLNEVVKTLKKFLGEDYEKYTLNVTTNIIWYSYPVYTYPGYTYPIYTCGDNSGYQLPTSGVYNLVVGN